MEGDTITTRDGKKENERERGERGVRRGRVREKVRERELNC